MPRCASIRATRCGSPAATAMVARNRCTWAGRHWCWRSRIVSPAPTPWLPGGCRPRPSRPTWRQAGRPEPSGSTINPCDLYNFPNGCHIVEVEVDPERGMVRIVCYATVGDLGRALNPILTVGQIHGGLTPGHRPGNAEACRVRSAVRPAAERQFPGLRAAARPRYTVLRWQGGQHGTGSGKLAGRTGRRPSRLNQRAADGDDRDPGCARAPWRYTSRHARQAVRRMGGGAAAGLCA